MSPEKFAPLLGEWFPYFEEFIVSKKMDDIYAFLKAESGRGIKICPESKDVFRAFSTTPPDKLKCIWVLQDPYYQIVSGNPIASGIAMSCEKTGKLQPSLQYFYDEVERKLYPDGMCLNCFQNPDLSYLCRQGVMMLNSDLTVQAGKAGSHQGKWEEFQRYFIERVINPYFPGVVFVLSGRSSQRLEKYVNKERNYVFKVSHPASAAHRGDLKWDTGTLFNDVDKLIQENYEEKIFWLDDIAPF